MIETFRTVNEHTRHRYNVTQVYLMLLKQISLYVVIFKNITQKYLTPA